MEPLQEKLREVLEGEKYLLVLDDLWNENCLQWRELAKFLKVGLKGAWVLVTTRSRNTATIVATKHIHELEGLSKDDSWRLFEITAFGQKVDQSHPSELVEIGQGIIEKCANVPLAIKVVGSLLYGQEKEKWLQFLRAELGQIKYGKSGGIGPILKLSYYHLEPPVKTCFSYCALFPKDHVIDRETLIRLWMAQDYIVPQKDQSIADVGEEYFSVLVKRCFFQDITKDIHGKIVSCKIHDLMHDIAQEVAGHEIIAGDAIEMDLDNRVRHLSYGYMGDGACISFAKAKVRTCLRISQSKQVAIVDKLLRSWMCLRTLDLSNSSFKSLPNDLVKLLHLRYLDLSYNDYLESLPNSFSKLRNLQTLSLHFCCSLRELPIDLPELVNLMVLDVDYCRSLSSFPKGMGRLTCLQKLPMFLVGDAYSSSKQSIVHQMEELKALTHLKGKLTILLHSNFEYAEKSVNQGGYMRNKKHLDHLHISFYSGKYRATETEQLLLLEDLQPHCNLRELSLVNYGGMRMPSWAREDNLATFLPNLVKLDLYGCPGLQYLPSLRKLCNLRSLALGHLHDLEYIEKSGTQSIAGDVTAVSESRVLFPFLKQLELKGLYKLKGWWSDEDGIVDGGVHKEPGHLLTSFPSLSRLTIDDAGETSESRILFPFLQQLASKVLYKLKGWWRKEDELFDDGMHEGQRYLLTSFPSLSKLTIKSCPNFKCVITCPDVEQLELQGTLNEQMRISIPFPFDSANPKLRRVRYDNTGALRLVSPIRAFQSVKEMEIVNANQMRSLSEVEEVFRSCSSSLQKLQIWGCEELNSLHGGLEHLTALESLSLVTLPKLNTSKGEGEEDDEMPWRCLQKLQTLRLSNIKQLSNIPKGIRCLKALQQLRITHCEWLESLPEFMRELTALSRLEIEACSDDLKTLCQPNTGEDWPNIQHIRLIKFRD